MNALQKLFEEYTIDELAKIISKDYIKPSLAIRLVILYQEIQSILIFSKSLKENTKINFNRIPLPTCQCEMIFEENPHLDKDYLKDIPYLIHKISYKKLKDGNKFEKESADGDNTRIVNLLKQKVYNLFKDELKKGPVISNNKDIQKIINLLINFQTGNDLP